jgi:hypothetical protein
MELAAMFEDGAVHQGGDDHVEDSAVHQAKDKSVR